jgi:hypothetical protein
MKEHQTHLKAVSTLQIRVHIQRPLMSFPKKSEKDSSTEILFSQLQQDNLIKTQIFLELKEMLKLFKNPPLSTKISDRDNQIHLQGRM